MDSQGTQGATERIQIPFGVVVMRERCSPTSAVFVAPTAGERLKSAGLPTDDDEAERKTSAFWVKGFRNR